MHILLTNDDGYLAEGIRQLARALINAGHRVTVTAPDSEKSAISHAIHVNGALMVRSFALDGVSGLAVDGYPADCARLGVFLTREDRPDFCISGINRGPNLGGACIYSGTVNAAMEASMAGIPALAASLDSFSSDDYSAAANTVIEFLPYALSHPLKRGEIYNLNVPCVRDIKGVYFTQALAPEYLTEANYEAFTGSYGKTYYFLADGDNFQAYPPLSDKVMLKQGWATVSVLTWDIAVKGRALPENGPLNLKGDAQ